MMTDNATPPIEAPAPQTAARAPRRPLALILAVAALAAAGWQTYEGLGQRAAIAALQTGTSATDAGLQERLDALQSRLAALEAPAPAPEGDAADGREAALLLEVEQALTLAGQQLQLAGNVPVALLALQGADARLARADRPQYLPLRKALLKDIELCRRCRRPTCPASHCASSSWPPVSTACRWPAAVDRPPNPKKRLPLHPTRPGGARPAAKCGRSSRAWSASSASTATTPHCWRPSSPSSCART
jgi:uncharacterized protein HemX